MSTADEARILAAAGRHTAAARLSEAFVRFHQDDTPATFSELCYAITGACEELTRPTHDHDERCNTTTAKDETDDR